MSTATITALMFAAMLVVIATGFPVAFGLGAVAVFFTWWQWGSAGLYMVATRCLGLMDSQSMLAVPMFVMMGALLEKSGISDSLYDMMHKWIGSVPGGLAIGTVAICTVFAAMTGLSGAATISMGLIALPAMLRRGYSKQLAVGSIAAGGALGILIPPSVTMIVYALVAEVSVGKLFIGGVGPGLLLSGLFSTYILVRCRFQPHLGPPLPREERATWSMRLSALRSVVLPVFVIAMVLGTIFLGIATVAEASVIGVIGSALCAVLNRRMSLTLLKESAHRTISLLGMAAWISLGAMTFATIYDYVGAKPFVTDLLVGLAMGRWGTLIMIQMLLFVLGAFLDIWGIIMICTPVFVAVISALGFDPIWFGVLFIVNMEMAYLTPPYGFNLFYMKGVVPPHVSMTDIYRSVVPFVGCQATGLALIMIFPQIVLWLPGMMFTPQ
jgi:tripartite ATP-independent transporter DctM subunit